MKLRIAEVRRAKGVTQGELARKIGATQSMVGKLERGEREMTFSWLGRIAHVLDVPTGDLLDASDEPPKVGVVGEGGLVTSEEPPRSWADVGLEDVNVFHVAEVNRTKMGVSLSDDVNIKIPAGALLVYEGRQRRPSHDTSGHLVLAWTTADGGSDPQQYVLRIGVLMPGSESRRYHLLPVIGRPLTNVLVHWVVPITEIRF